MTAVVSLKSPIGPDIIAVGQTWKDKNGTLLTVMDLDTVPHRDATDEKDYIRVSEPGGGTYNGTLIDFVKVVTELVSPVDLTKVNGLHGHHLKDSKQTIMVGQRWQHYKGDIYVITSVALDANYGSSKFEKARVSYRSLQAGDGPEWSLTVEEFLRAGSGVTPRFTPVKLPGKNKRDLVHEKSLYHYWKMMA